MNNKALIEILKSRKKPVITVFGDFCIDKYLYIDGALDEISLETGLTAYQVVKRKIYAGAGGTIVNNLCSLGAKVYCVGILGEDGDGYELEKCLKEVGADTSFMIHTEKRYTCAYEKPIRLEKDSEHEMNRIDIKNFSKTPMALQEKLIENIKAVAELSDGVIICDQFEEEDFAAVTSHIRKFLGNLARIYSNVVFYVDSRRYIDRFNNSILKCNEKEISKIFGIDAQVIDGDTALKYAELLYKKKHMPIYVTLGEYGSVLFDGNSHKIPPFPVKGPIDIVGAGDAFNAGAVFALTKGATYEEAAYVGSAASSIVIKQLKVTGTANLEDIIILLKNM